MPNKIKKDVSDLESKYWLKNSFETIAISTRTHEILRSFFCHTAIIMAHDKKLIKKEKKNSIPL